MRAVVFSGLLLCCTVAQSGVLWGKAEVGGNLDTIKRAHPEGREVQPTDLQRLDSGAKLLYEIEGVQVNKDAYKASFYFKDNALEQVTLKSDTNVAGHLCDAQYSSLHSALSGKYGAPVNVRGAAPSRGISQSTFVSGGLNVSTFAMASPSNCSISIFYTDRSGGAAANL